MIVSPIVRLAAPALAALVLAGCNPLSRQSLDSWSITYKIPIWQGVVVTQEMVDQLKPGMTRDQVRFVLGTPIVTDPFHADRWDYPYRFSPGRGPVEERRFTVFFKENRMVAYNGDSMPTEEEFAKSRNFATTKIVRGLPPVNSPSGQSRPSTGGPDTTTVVPGRNPVPDRSTSPNDQTPVNPGPASQ